MLNLPAYSSLVGVSQNFGLWLRFKGYSDAGTLTVSLVSGKDLGDTDR